MVHRLTAEAYNTGSGITGPYLHTTTATPVRRGTVTITAGAQSAVDDGVGGFVTTPPNGTGTINYTTGQISITFINAVLAAVPITITYDAHQGLPVMGVMNYFTQDSIKELIVADTVYINRYNAATNRLDDISPASPLTGTKSSFLSWTNYPSPQTDLQRLIFVNFKDPPKQYDGTSITPYYVYTVSTQITAVASGVVGNGTVGPYAIQTPLVGGLRSGIVPGTLSVIDVTGAQTLTDDLFGNLIGDGTGTVNYQTGAISATFNVAVGVGNVINLTYKQLSAPIETALHVIQFKDRLLVVYTVENGGKNYGLRIRISGTGAFSDVFTIDAIGAGVIDVPSNSFISSIDFSRDDVILFTKTDTWVIRYTSNDVTPFTLNRIDGTRGSEAPHGTITYLNRTNAVSPLGFILSDGYSVVRSDDKIPDYSYNSIDQDNFNLCFAGSVDIDRDHYLIHPSPDEEISDRILVTNYDEDNFAVYRIPLSCMGTFSISFNTTWNDLVGKEFKNWKTTSNIYGSWQAFAYTKGSPIAIGGGHSGQIVLLNNAETEDYPVLIRAISIVDDETLRVTTDFQEWAVNDIICLEAINGMYEATDKQAEIVNIQTANYTFDLRINTQGFQAYTSDGVASKCIEFNCKTKKFNPFANLDKKVNCGWLYFYVSTTGTDLTDNRYIALVENTSPCLIRIPGHGFKTGDQVYINGILGTTELNDNYYTITRVTPDLILLDDVDATGYGTYVSGGFCSVPVPAILNVQCISNDTERSTQINNFNPSPYQVNLSSNIDENGIKKWYKVYINQTARFVQFQVINNQAGSSVQIHAMMPGFLPTGRLV
jgi:hypothetical protein